MTLDDPRCRILREARAQLLGEYAAAWGQYNQELSHAVMWRLKQTIDSLDVELTELDERIRSCELGPEKAWDDRRRHLESCIPNINYTEVFDALDRILKHTRDQRGGAALVMLQNAHAMGGTWCLERMRRLLSEQTSDFRHYQIGQTPGERLDSWTVMRRLGSYLGCAPSASTAAASVQLQDYAQILQTTLEGAVQFGTVVLLEITTWDSLALPHAFLPWFISEFWAPLVRRLPSIIQRSPFVTVMCVVVAFTPVQVDSFDPALRCCSDAFDPTKLLPLPLRSWEQTEIQDWLYHYSGLGAPSQGIDLMQIQAMAEQVYLASEMGKPQLTREALLDALKHYYVGH